MSDLGGADKGDKKGKKKKTRPDVSPKALMKKLNLGKKTKKRNSPEEEQKIVEDSGRMEDDAKDDMKSCKESLSSEEQNYETPDSPTPDMQPENAHEDITTQDVTQESPNGNTVHEQLQEVKEPDPEMKNGTSQNSFDPSTITTISPEYEATAGVKKEYLYKILVIGELGTGKTSIIKRYVHQFFSQHYRATIGVDFALKVLNWDTNTIIRVQLWDIAGQERFGNMTRVYYKEAVGAFIVFDVTRAATFEAVVKWKQDLDAKVQLPDGRPIPCVLLANKCDQQKEGLVNQPNKMQEFCDEHKFAGWYETSAKDNINVEEAAKNLVGQIVNNDRSNDNGRNSLEHGKFPLDSPDYGEHRKGCSSC